VTLEILTKIPDGAPDYVMRTVTENGNSPRFDAFGCEGEEAGGMPPRETRPKRNAATH
jgi:hypothetical protein